MKPRATEARGAALRARSESRAPRAAWASLSREQLLELYYWMRLTRTLEERLVALYRQITIPIRALVRIFEAICERARHTHAPESLVEAARTALGPAISAVFAQDGTLSVLTLDPMVARAHRWHHRNPRDIDNLFIPWQAFVTLEQWPLTVNGKLDRKALPEPDGSRPALEKEYVAPHTAVEEVLSGIWSEVLGIEQISIHDTFFQLGGDSIRSIQVLAKARAAGFNLSVQQLFQHPTIYELAQTQLDENAEIAAGPLAAFSLISDADREALGEPGHLQDGRCGARQDRERGRAGGRDGL